MIPRLHLVTDDGILGRADFREMARRVLAEGGGAVALHLRGPRLPGRVLFGLAEELKPRAGEAGALLLANDRVDVALALELDGAHLGQRSLPPHRVRGLLGPDRTLGLSVHGHRELPPNGAGRPGAGILDFLLVGTLYPTASHPHALTGGPGRVTEMASRTSLPLLGIGGVTPERVGEVLDAGAHGVAVRGAVWDARDPVESLGVFLERIDDHRKHREVEGT